VFASEPGSKSVFVGGEMLLPTAFSQHTKTDFEPGLQSGKDHFNLVIDDFRNNGTT
jgi:hypothetical protein